MKPRLEALLYDDPAFHPLKQHLLESFQLSPEQAMRIAFFLLTHALIDRHLIFTVALDELQRGPGAAASEKQFVEAVNRAADGTFTRHLATANDRGLLSEASYQIAHELNRLRDDFLHWRPGRFQGKYKENDITTEGGLDFCFAEAFHVLAEIPFGGQGGKGGA